MALYKEVQKSRSTTQGCENGRGSEARGGAVGWWGSDQESESRRFRSPEEGVGLSQPLFGRPRTEAPDPKALAHLVSQAGQATYIEPSAPVRALPRGPPGAFPPTERQGPEFEVPGLSGRRGGCARRDLSPRRAEAGRAELPPQLPPQPPPPLWPGRAPAPDFSFILSCSLPRPASDWLRRV